MALNICLSNVFRHSKETKTTVKQIANINNNKTTEMSKAIKMHVK